MCFSASASFGAAAVIGTVGIITLKKVKHPSRFPFACIPLLFAVQQFTEGFVWLSLTNTEYTEWKGPATGLFLLFAQVVWPMLVPLSLYLIEKNARRKKILGIFTVMGVLTAAFLGWCLLNYTITTGITSYHIDYTLNYPVQLSWIASAVYVGVTILPPFISGNKKMPLLGILVLASFIVTEIYFPGYIISVWCYFAALISVVVLYLVIDMNKSGSNAQLVAIREI